MRFLLAIAVLASALISGAFVHADAEPVAPMAAPADRTGSARALGPVGRCLELPISLALAVTESESSRALSPGSLISRVGPAPTAPARTDEAQAPVSPPPVRPRACASPDDPGCQLSGPVPPSRRIQLGHADHGAAPPAQRTVPALQWCEPVVLPAVAPQGEPRSAHAPLPWRPPRTRDAS